MRADNWLAAFLTTPEDAAMHCRVALLPSVLWVILAACSPTAAPAAKPTAEASPPATQAIAAPAGLAPSAGVTPPATARPPAATDPRPATTGWKSFEDGELVGFKDAEGKVVLPPRYQVAQEFTPGGMACVVEGDGWVCIDGNGVPLLRPFVFDNGPDEFSEGLARFVEGEKIGFHDEAGVKQIPARFSFAQPFADGRAAFCDGCTRRCEGEHCSMSGGKWGLIDKTGAEAVAASFDEIGAFADGRARALRDGKALTIDRDGVSQTGKVKGG